MRVNSLRSRLLLSTALLVIVVLPATAFVLTSYYRGVVEAAFDTRLKVHLNNLIAVTLRPVERRGRKVGDQPPIALAEPLFQRPFSGWYWQIRDLDAGADATLVSDSLLDQRLPALKKGSETRGHVRLGYVTGPENQRLRLAEREIIAASGRRKKPDRYLFTVAIDADQLDEEVGAFRNMLLLALGLLGAGLLVAGVFQMRYVLRPLDMIGRRLGDIRSGKAARLSGRFPAEIEPLQVELNALLRANREIVERARTHVGNLAHALKTPLSVIANETAKARETGGAAASLADLVGRQADLMKDQVHHHLDRARMAAQLGVIGTKTEIAPVAGALCRTLEKIHRDRQLTISTECADGLAFGGEKQDLEEMLGNLLDNACKWARSRVRLTVVPAPERPGFLLLSVEDDGPGLSVEKRRQALKRGRRLDENRPGSGLGLSIVADLVQLYKGRVALEASPLGGLRAVLQLPAAQR